MPLPLKEKNDMELLEATFRQITKKQTQGWLQHPKKHAGIIIQILAFVMGFQHQGSEIPD